MTTLLLEKEFELYINQNAIKTRFYELIKEISQDYKDKPLYILGVLNGAFRIVADLVQGLDLPIKVGFVRVASYEGTHSTGNITRILGMPEDLEGHHVLIVEDIVDTGQTIHYLLRSLADKSVLSCEICTLLYKPESIKIASKLKYVGFEIPPAFVVGYGLDYESLGRELNGIYRLKE